MKLLASLLQYRASKGRVLLAVEGRARLLERELSDSRKAFRLFSFLNELHKMLQLRNCQDDLCFTLQLCGHFFSFFYFVADHWIWLVRIKVLPAQSPLVYRQAKILKNLCSLGKLLTSMWLDALVLFHGYKVGIMLASEQPASTIRPTDQVQPTQSSPPSPSPLSPPSPSPLSPSAPVIRRISARSSTPLSLAGGADVSGGLPPVSPRWGEIAGTAQWPLWPPRTTHPRGPATPPLAPARRLGRSASHASGLDNISAGSSPPSTEIEAPRTRGSEVSVHSPSCRHAGVLSQVTGAWERPWASPEGVSEDCRGQTTWEGSKDVWAATTAIHLVKQQRRLLLRDTVDNVASLVMAGQGSRLWKLPSIVVDACGVLSSCLGCYSKWPRMARQQAAVDLQVDTRQVQLGGRTHLLTALWTRCHSCD
mmetsp:Transcript_27806/g.64140  ORF Transcript_27806/g.64140 Transcript_27806/m.64140 type:complete len:422 (+) Transcript_27806:167-1432(+)